VAKEPQAEETMRRDSRRQKSLAALLLASNPSLMTSKSYRGIRAKSTPVVRTVTPTMSAMDLTSACLKEGCPVDLVTDLLEHLKAEPNPSPEVKKSMAELEKLLASNAPDKNDLEKVVTDMFTDMNKMFRVRAPTMSAMDLASDCLKQGCPVDSVSNLLEHLKAVKNPSAEVVKSMEELEKLLAASKPDKNELERVVGDMLASFSAEAPPMSAMDLASDCLKKGCPVDSVSNLLEHLKAVPNPSAEVLKSMKALEELLASSKPDKNELEKVVGDMLASFSAEAPPMNAMDLAADCLKEGCPVDLVSNLLEHLKAVQDPSAEVRASMKELEELIASSMPDKNRIEKVMEDMLASLSARAPTMTAMDLASDCLKDGCPVDMVSDLLSHLKAVPNPSSEVSKAIEELEKLLGLEKPDKNAMEKIVGDLLAVFAGPKATTAMSYADPVANKYFWAPKKATYDLASDCLKEGCPVDMVTDLVAQLKAEKNASPDAEKLIEQLEAVLAMEAPNKNALEQLVTSVAKGLKANYVTPMELMEGLGLKK